MGNKEQSAERQDDLKQAGLKVTEPRMKILEILKQAENRHLSAEDIYQILLKANIEVGLATIYRVLTQFEQAGLIKKHKFEGDQAVFELDQGTHHDHLVCCKCGRVEEFIDDVIEQRQQNIAEKAGFKMTDHALNIYGLCPNCQGDRK